MGIFFPRNMPLADGDLQGLGQIFREAFLSRLDHYNIVEEPGPGIMAVQASLITLCKAVYTDVPGIRAELRDVAQPSGLLFLMQLKDSDTDRVPAHGVDSATTPEFRNANHSTTDWGSVEAATDHWATLFRNFFDNDLGQ